MQLFYCFTINITFVNKSCIFVDSPYCFRCSSVCVRAVVRYPSTGRSVGGEKSCTTFTRKLYNIRLKVVQLFFDLSVRLNQRIRSDAKLMMVIAYSLLLVVCPKIEISKPRNFEKSKNRKKNYSSMRYSMSVMVSVARLTASGRFCRIRWHLVLAVSAANSL